MIVGGAQRSWSGRGLVEAGRGDLITCNPGEVHDGMPIGGVRAWKMLYLDPRAVASLALDLLGGANREFEFTNPVIDRRTDLVLRFEALYDAMIAPDGANQSEEHLLLLLSDLLRNKTVTTHASSQIARVKARIDDDPAAAITLEALAHEAGLSRFQVIRGFGKLTGLTPHAYIVQRRLDLARKLIETRAGLAESALRCGFADQSHFNRAFARRYGLTPGSYAAAFRS